MNIRNGVDNLAQLSPQETSSPASTARKITAEQDQSLSQSALAQPSHSQSDKSVLSSAATYLAQAPDISEVRLDKVAAIQSAIQAGTYQVPASDVAHKVMDSLLPSGKS